MIPWRGYIDINTGVRKQRGIFDVPDDFLTLFKESLDSEQVTRVAKAKKYLEVCEEIFGMIGR